MKTICGILCILFVTIQWLCHSHFAFLEKTNNGLCQAVVEHQSISLNWYTKRAGDTSSYCNVLPKPSGSFYSCLSSFMHHLTSILSSSLMIVTESYHAHNNLNSYLVYQQSGIDMYYSFIINIRAKSLMKINAN